MNQSFSIFRTTQNALMLEIPPQSGGSSGTGPTGCSFLSGIGEPVGTCNPCDTYVDLLTGNVYICVPCITPGPGCWTGPTGQNFMGPTGPTGTSFTSGTGAPAGPCSVGDTFVDLLTGDVYECILGSWTATNETIRGPTGPSGPFSNGLPAYGTMWVLGHEPYPSTVSPNPIFVTATWPAFTGTNQGIIPPATRSAYWAAGTGPNGAPLVGMSVHPSGNGMLIEQDGVYNLNTTLSCEVVNLSQNTEIEIGFFRNGTAIGLWASDQLIVSEAGIDFNFALTQIATLQTGDLVELMFASPIANRRIEVDNLLVTILRIA